MKLFSADVRIEGLLVEKSFFDKAKNEYVPYFQVTTESGYLVKISGTAAQCFENGIEDGYFLDSVTKNGNVVGMRIHHK